MTRQLGTLVEENSSDGHLADANQDEPFIYPGNEDNNEVDNEPDDEDFVYPGADTQTPFGEFQTAPSLPLQQPVSTTASPAQLESLYAAACSGDLSLLRRLFRNALDTSDVEPFSLANGVSSRTGFTALHAAASRGYLDIVSWLVEDCGAMPDLEDKEGETALHKAALNGHLPIVQYLLPDKSDVHARDADGWNALHNACSKGYLDIVRWLCEHGDATADNQGTRSVDARSNGGWTPLMNAASKGHLPVVLYLLTKQGANPLVRNSWGETAFDVAAAVFEVWICEVLQRFEIELWKQTSVSYDPLAVHTTIPLILYENQRLDTRLKTLAVSGGRPRFSASGLGKQGRRSPFELILPKADEATERREVPAWRSSVQLPLRDSPFSFPKPETLDQNEGAERSHFWLSDWTLDVTHPGVDAEDGWQYSHQFSDPGDQWSAEIPPPLQRLLTGNSTPVNFAVAGPSSRNRSSQGPRVPQTWVRRRRWVRVMRRRLDIPQLPFLQSDGSMYLLDPDGNLIPFLADNDNSSDDGQELGALPESLLAKNKDYVSRARYLVGALPSDTNSPLSPVDTRRAIAKLERGTTELRQGILADSDLERKTQAEVLLNAYSRELERRRLSAGAQGLLIAGEDEEVGEEDDSDDEFHYPGGAASFDLSARPSSRASSSDYFSRPSSRISRRTTADDLTPQLSQAPDFRVPTHEAPQKMLSRRIPTPHSLHAQWERDELVNQCRQCQRRFTFILRRHCRKCGRIFCDRCSSFRALLDPSEIVQDPNLPDSNASSSSQRVCHSCYEAVTATVPEQLRGLGANTMERVVIEQAHLAVPLSRRQSSSQLSDLAECPVCNTNLEEFGGITAQETHVRNCLEGGGSGQQTPQAAKYLVYRLPEESALIGVECVICLEEFLADSTVARLSCFCSFHSHCLTSWLQRGKSCPVHAR